MSHQFIFADSEFSSKRRQTRKEIFLSYMDQLLPWQSMSKVFTLKINHLVSQEEIFRLFTPSLGEGRSSQE